MNTQKSVDPRKERMRFITELSQEGRVYAASVYTLPGGERELLVFFPTNRGAYWRVRGKLAPSAEKQLKATEGQRGTWRQGPVGKVQWAPNPLAKPESQPGGMSLMHWLGDVPLVWFVRKEYAGG